MLEFLLTPVTLSFDKQSEIFHTQWTNSHSVEVPLQIPIIIIIIIIIVIIIITIIIIIIIIIITHFSLFDQIIDGPCNLLRLHFWDSKQFNNYCKNAMLLMHTALKTCVQSRQ